MRASSASVHPLRFGEPENSAFARVSVRRSGRRPLLFVGRILLEAQSEGDDALVRHAIKILELGEGGFGYSLEQRVQGCDVPYAEAGTADTLPEIAEVLRAFDASAHVSADTTAETDAASAFDRITKTRAYALTDYAETLAKIIKSQ